jgi:hypothetical protein
MRKFWFLSAALAPMVIASAANAVLISVTSPPPISSLIVFNAEAPGTTGTFVDPNYPATFSGTGHVENGTSANHYLTPFLDKSNFEAVGKGQAETITFSKLLTSFSLYWGSID